jgi:hypothetical protein
VEGNNVQWQRVPAIRKEGETMKFLECIIEKAIDMAGSEAFSAVLIKISSLYKYVGFFV